MSQYFEIHPTHPQKRLIKRSVEIVREGGVIAYPTDSGYALGCHIGDKHAMERIRKIRRLGKEHNFTLVCRDLTEISSYAKIENSDYRLLKMLTPGPYTFILKATHEVPRRLQNPKRKTIGIRIPGHELAHALLVELNEPLMSSTLILPDEAMAMSDPHEIREVLEHQVELVIDGGPCPDRPTTVLDLLEGVPVLIRQGGGDIQWLNP